GNFSKSTMTKHLASCKQGKAVSETSLGDHQFKKTKTFHLVIEGRDLPEYWMHIETSADTKLADLNGFLRATWLECCGHLSAFTIENKTYMSNPDEEMGDESMEVVLDDVLRPKMKFLHKYDFGTTTELVLRVVAEREGKIKKESIRVLARNDSPLITCDSCGKTATQVCSQCIYEGKGRLCGACAGTHECGEEMLLPVVNSPRIGMCGYSG
ncbi:MAG: hypothetical protein HY920_06240, partial [Elusimicrobia bacterium]|nr:hypothetical protein [Elusimicrobiota bacterium]